MGTYYTIVNHTKRERINTVRIVKADEKFNGSAYGDPGRLMAYAMHARWQHDHVEVMDDGAGTIDREDWQDYADVTDALVVEYTRTAPTWAPWIEVAP